MSKLYKVWSGIVQRCYNPKAKNYGCERNDKNENESDA